MAYPSQRELTQLARKAGYDVLSIEQLRPNRWLLTLAQPQASPVLAMFQIRPLVGAADVMDLGDLVGLRRAAYGILIAHNGVFSASAQQTHKELRALKLHLCTSLPPIITSNGEVRAVSAMGHS
jgi:hypothetical protein